MEGYDNIIKVFCSKKELEYIKKINTLELKVKELEDHISSSLYNSLITKLNNDSTAKKLKEDNKRLRIKVKELKRRLYDEKIL